MHRGVAKGNEIAGIQEDVVEAGQVDDDDDPSNCDIHRNSGGEAVAIRSVLIKNNLLISYIFLRLVSIFLNSYAPCRFSQILTRVSILNEI